MSSNVQDIGEPFPITPPDPASYSNTGDNVRRPISVMRFFTAELTRGYLLEREEEKYAQKRQRVYTFMKTPRELEKFSTYGFFQCVDAFLFIFTFLPLRILLAVLKVVTAPCGFMRSRHLLEPAQICDILKGVILIVGSFIMMHIDTSMMYHLVRGQATIKLYVFFNMLDMADKLLSNFGHDILDALFWTATEPRGRRREHIGTLPHLVIAIIYVILHTMLILFQATVLNVAFNSHNKSLLVIMMSNNFVEIKANLFKKVDVNHLYQIACSDVKERFHYVLLLSVVCIRNMTEVAWNVDHLWVLLPDAVMVLLSEVLVDWGKHAFILKFNEIPADVYRDFKVKLAVDMANSRQNQAFTDHSDLVSRRMGLTPLPLACLLFRILSKSVVLTSWMSYAIVFVLYLCLISFKILNSIILLGHSYKVIERSRSEKSSESSSTNGEEKAGTPEAEPVTHSAPSPDTDLPRPASDSNVTRNFSEIFSADSYTELTFLPNTNVIEHTEGISFVPSSDTDAVDEATAVCDSNSKTIDEHSTSHSFDESSPNFQSQETNLLPHHSNLTSHDSSLKLLDTDQNKSDLNVHHTDQGSHESDPNLFIDTPGDSKERSHDNMSISHQQEPAISELQNSTNLPNIADTEHLIPSVSNDASDSEDTVLVQRNQRFFVNFGRQRRLGSSSSLPEMVRSVSSEDGNQSTGPTANGKFDKEEKLD